LPEEMIKALKEIGPINTYGDLTFIYQSYKLGSLDKSLADKFGEIFETAKQNGFDVSVLDRIV
jgi:uncharacterized protein (UPF0335 family)